MTGECWEYSIVTRSCLPTPPYSFLLLGAGLAAKAAALSLAGDGVSLQQVVTTPSFLGANIGGGSLSLVQEDPGGLLLHFRHSSWRRYDTTRRGSSRSSSPPPAPSCWRQGC